jgi:hypothetical protein
MRATRSVTRATNAGRKLIRVGPFRAEASALGWQADHVYCCVAAQPCICNKLKISSITLLSYLKGVEQEHVPHFARQFVLYHTLLYHVSSSK